MTRLRKMMLEELQRRNHSAITTRNYLLVGADFAKYFGESPDKLGPQRTSDLSSLSAARAQADTRHRGQPGRGPAIRTDCSLFFVSSDCTGNQQEHARAAVNAYDNEKGHQSLARRRARVRGMETDGDQP